MPAPDFGRAGGGITTTNILFNLISIAVLSAYLAFIYHASIKTGPMKYYIAVHFFAFISLMVDFLALLAQGTGAQHLFTILSSSAGILCSVALMCFGLVLLRKKSLNRYFLIAVYLIPTLSFLFALLAEQSLILEQAAGIPKPGTLYKIHSWVEYLFRVSACVLLAATVTKRISISPFEIFLVAASMVSFTLKIMISLQQPAYVSPVGPIMALMVFSLLFFGSAKLGMYHVMALGIKRSLELYGEAVFIMDSRGKVAYMNPACEGLEHDTFQAVYDVCRLEAQELREYAEGERILEVSHNHGVYTVRMRAAPSLFRNRAGTICVIHDDTALKTAINHLKEKNEELVMLNNSIRLLQDQTSHLAAIEERNSLAKEIHDVLGHSLNLALHTLESNRLILDTQPEKALMRLKQVITDIDRGIGEIAAHAEPREKQSPLWSLLAEMADRLAEIGVRMDVIRSRNTGEMTDDMVKTIYRICQEATTNAIRHGKADQITVSIKEKAGLLHIHIIDNGKGCGKIIKGNGLRGMEERVGNLGGYVSFNSFEDGNGFMVHAFIPLENMALQGGQ